MPPEAWAFLGVAVTATAALISTLVSSRKEVRAPLPAPAQVQNGNLTGLQALEFVLAQCQALKIQLKEREQENFRLQYQLMQCLEGE